MDVLGSTIRAMRDRRFRGIGRLVKYWGRRQVSGEIREATVVGGMRLLCDMGVPYERMIWLGWEEPTELRLVRALLRPGQTFVDCGANVGLFTLAAASAVGPMGRVHAFEPNPATFERLNRNLSHNGVWNVIARAAALGERPGHVNLVACDEHNRSHVSPDGAGLRVPVTTLDETLGGETVAGIKIDVEGYELHVLKGTETVIAVGRPWILVEFNTRTAGVHRLSHWDVDRRLRGLGYRPATVQDALARSPKDLGDDWGLVSGYANLLYRPADAEPDRGPSRGRP